MLKKAIPALLLILCLMLPAAAFADAPLLPDLGAFAGDRLRTGDTEDFDFALRVTYYGDKADVKAAALAYIDLLLEEYGLCKHAHFTTTYEGGQTLVRYALGYTGPEEIGTVGYHSDEEGWQISAANVILMYSQYQADNFVQITYRHEFSYADQGERMAGSMPLNVPSMPETTTEKPTSQTTAEAAAEATAKPAARTIACTACGGDGHVSRNCSSCGGDGRVSRSCSSCDGSGHHRCSSCNGTGHHSSSRHGGSHHGSDSCSSCGGDGKRACSSCSGKGVTKSACSSCGGAGHHRSTCSACGGAGKVSN